MQNLLTRQSHPATGPFLPLDTALLQPSHQHFHPRLLLHTHTARRPEDKPGDIAPRKTNTTFHRPGPRRVCCWSVGGRAPSPPQTRAAPTDPSQHPPPSRNPRTRHQTPPFRDRLAPQALPTEPHGRSPPLPRGAHGKAESAQRRRKPRRPENGA